MSITETDLYISEKIYEYAYVRDYQSQKRKCDKYQCGQSALIAFFMELYDYKNDDLRKIIGFEKSSFRDLKSGKQKLRKEVVLMLCVAFKLDYLNSVSFLKALGYGLNPDLVFNGNSYIHREDYYIALFLTSYRDKNDEEIKNMKKLFPIDLHFLFLS